MLLVATEDDVVQAFDATTGKELWRRSGGRPVAGSLLPCGNINPLGITGTPGVDPSTQAIYFDAAVERANGPRHEVFGLSLKDGAILPGWPIDVSDALQKLGRHVDPRAPRFPFSTALSMSRSAVTLVIAAIITAGWSDFHCMIPARWLASRRALRGGGIWAPGGLSVVGHDIFFATGNTFGAGNWSDGEAVFRLGPDLQRTDNKQDYFAPVDWKMLDAHDEDLGGSNPLPLNVPGAGSDQHLILALGKDRKAYLLDRDDLGGIGGQLAAATVSDIRIITSPAAYPVDNDIFVAFQAPGTHCPGPIKGNGLTVLKISGGSPPTMNTAWCGGLSGRGSAIATTTDGHSNSIVWILGAEGDNRLHGFRGDTGEPIVTSEPLSGLRHFQTLIATQDRLYVGADGRIYAFSF
jgi:hypothetical protein